MILLHDLRRLLVELSRTIWVGSAAGTVLAYPVSVSWFHIMVERGLPQVYPSEVWLVTATVSIVGDMPKVMKRVLGEGE